MSRVHSNSEIAELQKKYDFVDQPGGSFNLACKKCGGDVLAATVAHAIWDGPFPMSGSGQCEYESVPYCPRCEKKPDYHGTPIER